MLALLHLLAGTPFGCLRQVGSCLFSWARGRRVQSCCSPCALPLFAGCLLQYMPTLDENNVAFRDHARKLFACFSLDITVRATKYFVYELLRRAGAVAAWYLLTPCNPLHYECKHLHAFQFECGGLMTQRW